MFFSQFLLGIAVGVMASIPLGPIGVLCVQRTLNNNFKTGFISGLGAATADTIFSIVAMFFLSMVLSFIEVHMSLFTLIGGAILGSVGINIYMGRKKVIIRRNRHGSRNIFKDYISVLFLTLTNPAFILVFVTLFATFGVDGGKEGSHTVASALTVISGVASGCCLWWFILTFCIDKLRNRFRPRHLLYLNMIAGMAIFILGLIAVLSAIIPVISSMI